MKRKRRGLLCFPDPVKTDEEESDDGDDEEKELLKKEKENKVNGGCDVQENTNKGKASDGEGKMSNGEKIKAPNVGGNNNYSEFMRSLAEKYQVIEV